MKGSEAIGLGMSLC